MNAALFVLIGIEVVIVQFTGRYLVAGLVAFPLVLLARWISVGLPLVALRRIRPSPPGTLTILTWAGLRGGISVALALSLPESAARAPILTATYVVVCLSIVGQGLTVGRVVRRVMPVGHRTSTARRPSRTPIPVQRDSSCTETGP